jgi:hypothetical protein
MWCIWYYAVSQCLSHRQVASVAFCNAATTGNDLVGELPPEISLLSGLKRFLAPKNALRGDLGVAFANLTALEAIDVLDNGLSGTIPSFIFERNPGLSSVIVAGNSFTGPIPSDISGATKLNNLKLSGNQLTGTIPSEIGRLKQLRKHFMSAFLPLLAWLVCILT